MPTPVPGLASANDSIDGLVYFPRMLSKIRLHAAGKLPEAYVPYLGDAPAYGGHVFDARCCRLLGVSYDDLVQKTLSLPDDAAVLAWARTAGKNTSAEKIEIWSAYAAKRGWRDDASPSMRKWAAKLGADPDAVMTWFDGMDIDEGRKTPADFVPEPFNPGPFPNAPTRIPGLPSPYEEVGGLTYFPRMVAKIGLAAAGKLPEGWVGPLGWGDQEPAKARTFDSFCLRFLGLDYEPLKAKVLGGETDPAALLAWAYATGTKPTEEEIAVWNAFMRKRGWHDNLRDRLLFRLGEAGLPADAVQTMFDYIDLDEGRPVRNLGAE